MRELRLYKSRRKALGLLLGSLLFVGLGLLMLSQPDAPQWVAWLCTGLFGLGIPISLFQLLDRRPQIIINEVGIFDRTAHRQFINWELIYDAYLVEMNRQRFICLVVDEAYAPSRRQGTLRRGLARLNCELGFQELNISLGFVQVDTVRLTEFLLAMLQAAPPERTFLVERAIAGL